MKQRQGGEFSEASGETLGAAHVKAGRVAYIGP